MPSPWGTLRQLRLPTTPADKQHAPPPKQGEHTDAVLREAGVDDADDREAPRRRSDPLGARRAYVSRANLHAT